MAALFGALLSACAAESRPIVTRAQHEDGSILIGSNPAGRSTVASPVDELVLRFNPPARLDEVTVSGPDGTMPMMVHPIGEAADYSLPLPALGPGHYTVNWRANAQGREHLGRFEFIVR